MTRITKKTQRAKKPTGLGEVPMFNSLLQGVSTLALPGTGQLFATEVRGQPVEPRPTAAEWIASMKNGPSYAPQRTPQDRWERPEYLYTDMEIDTLEMLMYYDGPVMVLAALGDYYGRHLGVRSVDVVPGTARWVFVHVPDDGYTLSAIRTGEMPFYDLFKAGNCVIVDVEDTNDGRMRRTFEMLGADIPDDCLPERGFAAAC